MTNIKRNLSEDSEFLNSKTFKEYQKKNKKLRWDLVPWEALEKVVEVITKGAEKYGIDNWKTVPNEIFEGGMLRHFISWKKGERYDKEWNFTHLAHFTCNALFILWKEIMSIKIEERGELQSNGASKEKENGDVKNV